MSMTRQEMTEVIRGGGSVLHNGRLITQEEHISKILSLSAEGRDAERARLQAQMDELDKSESSSKGATGGGNEQTPESLSKMKRGDLETLAAEKGVENPADFPNIGELAKAVFAKTGE